MAEARTLLRMSEVADRLAISRSKAYQLAQAGRLPGAIRVGNSVRVSAVELDRWIAENSTKPAP